MKISKNQKWKELTEPFCCLRYLCCCLHCSLRFCISVILGFAPCCGELLVTNAPSKVPENTGATFEILEGIGNPWVEETGMLKCSANLSFPAFMVLVGTAASSAGSSTPAPCEVPVCIGFLSGKGAFCGDLEDTDLPCAREAWGFCWSSSFLSGSGILSLASLQSLWAHVLPS